MHLDYLRSTDKVTKPRASCSLHFASVKSAQVIEQALPRCKTLSEASTLDASRRISAHLTASTTTTPGSIQHATTHTIKPTNTVFRKHQRTRAPADGAAYASLAATPSAAKSALTSRTRPHPHALSPAPRNASRASNQVLKRGYTPPIPGPVKDEKDYVTDVDKANVPNDCFASQTDLKVPGEHEIVSRIVEAC